MKVKTTNKYDFIEIKQPKKISAFNYQIPGDISSASFFIALTILAGNSKLLIKNVNSCYLARKISYVTYTILNL